MAHACNRVKYRRHDRLRRQLYADELDQLLEENGPLTRPRIELRDGWAIDTSRSLPHLDRVLADADQIIADRGGSRHSEKGKYRSYFQDL